MKFVAIASAAVAALSAVAAPVADRREETVSKHKPTSIGWGPMAALSIHYSSPFVAYKPHYTLAVRNEDTTKPTTYTTHGWGPELRVHATGLPTSFSYTHHPLPTFVVRGEDAHMPTTHGGGPEARPTISKGHLPPLMHFSSKTNTVPHVASTAQIIIVPIQPTIEARAEETYTSWSHLPVSGHHSPAFLHYTPIHSRTAISSHPMDARAEETGRPGFPWVSSFGPHHPSGSHSHHPKPSKSWDHPTESFNHHTLARYVNARAEETGRPIYSFGSHKPTGSFSQHKPTHT